MAVFTVVCITINHRVFIKFLSNSHAPMPIHTHTHTHTCTDSQNPNFPFKISITSSNNMNYFNISHSSFLSPSGTSELLRILSEQNICFKVYCIANTSYKHCVLIKRQFQFSQEHSNLKEVSHLSSGMKKNALNDTN